jgi:ribulose-5-phosphate 4-epimerase/fuculose-1-phosphate aldolase
MTDTADLRTRIAEACRVLGKLDLSKAATGHISARISGTERVLVRGRGPDELGIRYTTENQILEVDLNGKLVGDSAAHLESPIEIFIHTAIYRRRPEVNAVVHIHPPMALLFTICEKPLLPLYGAFDPNSAQLALEGIPTYDRSIPIDTPELGDDVAVVLGSARTCMMRGHGITTAGPSVEEAAIYAIQLNELATINYQARLLGNPKSISEEDQIAFRKMARPRAGKSLGVRPSGRTAALWKYYCTLTADR